MENPNADKIAKRANENMAKGAVALVKGSPEWQAALAGLKKHGVEYAQPEVSRRFHEALERGEITVWKLSDGTFHLTERGFSPGNVSLS